MGGFKSDEIPHPSQIPGMVMTLAADANWLLTDCPDPVFNKVARVMIRLVAMQPFQDGNKRTAFVVAAYMLSYCGKAGLLIPDQADCQMFIDAVYSSDEAAVVRLLERWYAE